MTLEHLQNQRGEAAVKLDMEKRAMQNAKDAYNAMRGHALRARARGQHYGEYTHAMDAAMAEYEYAKKTAYEYHATITALDEQIGQHRAAA